MNYYERHLGDYARDTSHLTMLEHGAYSALLDRYYSTERPIPAADVHRFAGARTPDERAAVDTVLRDFFHLDGDAYRHHRCDAEIERAYVRIEAARSNGLKGGRPRKNPAGSQWVKSANPAVTQTEPSTNPDESSPVSSLQTPVLNTSTSDEVDCLPPAADDRPTLALVPSEPATPTRKRTAPTVPACPHLAILAAWAEVLPEQHQHDAEQWNGTREAHLRARWRETAISEAKAGRPWRDSLDGVKWFRDTFAYMRHSRFLMGKVAPGPGRKQFRLSLEFIVMPEKWQRLIEGYYHQDAKAI